MQAAGVLQGFTVKKLTAWLRHAYDCGLMDELNIEFHHARSRRLLGDELPRSEITRDLHMHALAVTQAIQDQYGQCIGVAQRLHTREAHEYMLYGVGRRMSMILFSLRSLLEIVVPGRELPIDAEEGRAVTRDLNTVYINIVGVIDNLAWACFHERAPHAGRVLEATQIGLFTRAFGRTAEFQPLAEQLQEFRAWFDDLRNRRDPAAHRIPLYVPPAVLNEAQAAEHGRLGEQANEAIRRHDWRAWDGIMDQQQQLGRLAPVFLHSPGAPIYYFYPTIPEDVGQMIKIVRIAVEFLQGA